MHKQYNSQKKYDPVDELLELANALFFLEKSLRCHDIGEIPVQAIGAAYISGLIGERARDIACAFWNRERASEETPAGRSACTLCKDIQGGYS